VLARAALVGAAARRAELERAAALAGADAPAVTRTAARALLADATGLADASRWIDVLLAAGQAPAERAGLFGERARRALAEPEADLAGGRRRRGARRRRWCRAPPPADYLAVAVAIARHRDDDRALAAGARRAGRGARAGDRAATLLSRRPRHTSRSSRRPRAGARPALSRLGPGGDRPGRAAATVDRDDRRPGEREPRRARAARARRGGVAAAAFSDVARAYAALLTSPGAPDDGDRAVIEFRLASALERSGDGTTAIALLDRAAPRLPGELRGQAYRLIAELHERKGELTAAAAALESFAEATDASAGLSTRADALYRAGELFRRRPGHADDAVRCLEAALRLADDHLPALDALELIERDLGDLERVATILGRKIAASARQPSRQKALLVRLAAIHVQLERPDVARITLGPRARARSRLPPGDPRAGRHRAGPRPAPRAGRRAGHAGHHRRRRRRRQPRSHRRRDRARRADRRRSAGHPAGVARADDRDRRVDRRGDQPPGAGRGRRAPAHAGRRLHPQPGAAPRRGRAGPQRRPARARPRAAGRARPPPATRARLRELADVCAELGDWPACSRRRSTAWPRRHEPAAPRPPPAEVLLELADVYYDRLSDLERARATMRAAADAHGPSARRDATLRLLAAEASAAEDHGEAAAALGAIAPERRSAADVWALASAWQRRGHDHRAIAVLEAIEAAGPPHRRGRDAPVRAAPGAAAQGRAGGRPRARRGQRPGPTRPGPG
jgi:tetratricopeptide (TPR) repeat protein